MLPQGVSTKNVSQIGPAVWLAIYLTYIYIYERRALIYVYVDEGKL